MDCTYAIIVSRSQRAGGSLASARMDGMAMTEQAERSNAKPAGRIVSDSSDRASIESARGPILPRFDAGKLNRHLPNLQRIRIEINGVFAGAPQAIPDAVREFAIGWAFVHRFFNTADQLGKISATSSHVSMMVDSGIDLDRLKYESIGWIPRSDLELARTSERSTRVPRAASIMSEMDAIATCRQSFDRFDDDGARAGYRHVALATADDVVCMARDLHAGAAASKVLGWAVSSGADCSASILVVRGVLDDRLVEASARAGIPIVATDAVPTVQAVALAALSCVSILGLALSHRRGLFADGGHLGNDIVFLAGSENFEFEPPDA